MKKILMVMAVCLMYAMCFSQSQCGMRVSVNDFVGNWLISADSEIPTYVKPLKNVPITFVYVDENTLKLTGLECTSGLIVKFVDRTLRIYPQKQDNLLPNVDIIFVTLDEDENISDTEPLILKLGYEDRNRLWISKLSNTHGYGIYTNAKGGGCLQLFSNLSFVRDVPKFHF